jgi:hypothetical protein
MKLRKKIVNPTRLIDNICNTPIFGFNTRSRTRENGLPFGRPRDEVVVEKNTIAICGAYGVWNFTLISVSVGDKLCDGVW